MSLSYKTYDTYYERYYRDFRDKQPNTELGMGTINLLCSQSPHQDNVIQFMKMAGQRVRQRPTMPTVPELLLRAKLQTEECLEKVDALGVDILYDGKPLDLSKVSFDMSETKYPDLVEIVDGCCDSIVIATGTLAACGVADQGVQAAVDSHNMKKFGPGGFRDKSGKWVKPHDWVPPPLEELLRLQGWDGSNTPEPLD